MLDKGSNALLARLLPDLQKMGHPHAHQPDLNGHLCLQQPKGHCLYLCSCADVLRQAVGSGPHLESSGLQLQCQGLALEVFPGHISGQVLGNLCTLQNGQPLELW